MSFSTNDFDKWMKSQGTRPSLKNSGLNDDQIRLLKNYPEVQSANDLPFEVQQDIIALNEYDNLQNEVDAFLENQYSLLSRKFKDFITSTREPTE